MLSTELKRKLATVKRLKASVSRVSPSSEQLELRYWWEYGDEKTRINKLN